MNHETLQELRAIKSLPSLVKYLRDELDWPIESEDVEDISFSYEPEELGLDAAHAAKINQIKQIRPLETNQPWGIFWVSFEKKKLPVVVLRRILGGLVVKSRQSANNADRARWKTHDLLFVSAYGDESSDQREIAFAHFNQTDGDLPTLKVLGWDGADTVLKLEHVSHILAEKLRWPENPADADAWRAQWSSAFRHRIGHVVRTADHLAEVLAELARRIRDAGTKLLHAESDHGPLTKLFTAFQAALIHDLTKETFADAYAQTITYGLFTAAINRTEMSAGTAGTYVKADDIALMARVTSPFLKEMLEAFLTVGGRKNGVDFDELGVQDVVELLRGDETDLPEILRNFGDRKPGEDPVIHFYEHFLSAYNKKLKIQRGVFYTPQPVVSYIVRSVHELLQIEFGLEDGLASTITWREMLQRHKDLKLPTVNEPGEPEKTISPDEPFVQILDPATGTATFLVEVVDIIHRTLTAKWRKQGHLELEMPRLWNEYVPKHLLPRLHGYELLAAPYAIAHLKLGLKLTETGYRFGSDERARIYLTNALEPRVRQLPQIGFEPLAHEAKAVNEIKWYKRFTVVIGNPPYSNFGQLNKIPFILNLLEDYKRGLDEKKINLDDDFIKFVRLAQHLLDAARTGVFGFITNNIFLEGATHRQMRKFLADSFDHLFVVDLHGDGRKQEKDSAGSPDENVFDIIQGVSISLFGKSTSAGRAATQVKAKDLIGARSGHKNAKYEWLVNHSQSNTDWTGFPLEPPSHFFVRKDLALRDEYLAAPSINEVLTIMWSGIQTKRDSLAVAWTPDQAWEVVKTAADLSPAELKTKFGLPEDGDGWDSKLAITDLRESGPSRSAIIRYAYRPLDTRFLYYTGKTRGWLGRPRKEASDHLLKIPNRALIVKRSRMINVDYFCHMWVVDSPPDINYLADQTYFVPLYAATDSGDSLFGKSGKRRDVNEKAHNVSLAVVRRLTDAFKIEFLPEGVGDLAESFGPEDIFHYAYGVFHSPGYRSRYAEFLKIDFPRLPLTGNLELFRVLARLGGELVALHVLESPKLDQPNTEYLGGRAPEVEKVSWSKNTVWLDKAQTTGFKGVREDVWNFHIGGYQVCEKWLKDRKGRTLSADDRTHYQRIVVALSETIFLMKEIDQVIDHHGGWPIK